VLGCGVLTATRGGSDMKKHAILYLSTKPRALTVEVLEVAPNFIMIRREDGKIVYYGWNVIEELIMDA